MCLCEIWFLLTNDFTCFIAITAVMVNGVNSGVCACLVVRRPLGIADMPLNFCFLT
jgi:hypothetical protein